MDWDFADHWGYFAKQEMDFADLGTYFAESSYNFANPLFDTYFRDFDSYTRADFRHDLAWGDFADLALDFADHRRYFAKPGRDFANLEIISPNPKMISPNPIYNVFTQHNTNPSTTPKNKKPFRPKGRNGN